MEFKATLEERTSRKTGNVYKCVVVHLTDKLEKIILLSDCEVELLELIYAKRNNNGINK